MNARQRIGYAALAAVLAAFACAPPPTTAVKPPGQKAAPALPNSIPTIPRPGGALGLLDQVFVESYVECQRAVAMQTSPVVTMSGSELFLYLRGRVTREVVIPDRYHTLKAVAHAPFATFLILKPLVDGAAVPVGTIDRLRLLMERVGAAEAGLANADLTEEERKRAGSVLSRTSTLLSSVLTAQRADASALRVFAKEVGPLLLSNAWDAGCSQVDSMHAQMMKWKGQMTAEERGRLKAVTRGAHQARYDNAATQYFAWLLGEKVPAGPYPGESDRVLYAETIFGQQTARDVLAGVIIDAEASEAFFGDPHRMSEDILRDGAKHCIASLHRDDHW